MRSDSQHEKMRAGSVREYRRSGDDWYARRRGAVPVLPSEWAPAARSMSMRGDAAER